jgi:hypothetical protein
MVVGRRSMDSNLQLVYQYLAIIKTNITNGNILDTTVNQCLKLVSDLKVNIYSYADADESHVCHLLFPPLKHLISLFSRAAFSPLPP